MDLQLKDRTALVTGGSRGLGKSTALHLAKDGVDIVLTYHAQEAAALAVVTEIEAMGGKAVALQLDVAVSSSFAAFAEQVRRAIFTFVHLPARLAARDVPKLIRIIEQPVLVTALAASLGQPALEAASDFLLANMSQRMAQGLREEMATRGKVKDKEAEAAMSAIVTAIRQLEAAGEIVLQRDEE